MVSEVDGMTLLYVPAGEFLMGSADSNPNASSSEKPQHRVYLDAFWIDRTEVTNAMYKLCIQAEACQPPGETTYFGDARYGSYPVVQVTWTDANTYCTWAGRRLPTEAQWEKAARGVDGRTYPWGEGLACDKANYADCVGHTLQVGSYPDGVSPFGALDMAGNVWEWVADWYSEGYYAVSPLDNPLGPESGQEHVMRGGSWFNIDWYVPVTFRSWGTPDERWDMDGFRCSR
jgi:formylglycine-generating enzyme required for sulfatase activity